MESPAQRGRHPATRRPRTLGQILWLPLVGTCLKLPCNSDAPGKLRTCLTQVRLEAFFSNTVILLRVQQSFLT